MARLGSYLVGRPKSVIKFWYEPWTNLANMSVESGWAGELPPEKTACMGCYMWEITC